MPKSKFDKNYKTFCSCRKFNTLVQNDADADADERHEHHNRYLFVCCAGGVQRSGGRANRPRCGRWSGDVAADGRPGVGRWNAGVRHAGAAESHESVR